MPTEQKISLNKVFEAVANMNNFSFMEKPKNQKSTRSDLYNEDLKLPYRTTTNIETEKETTRFLKNLNPQENVKDYKIN